MRNNHRQSRPTSVAPAKAGAQRIGEKANLSKIFKENTAAKKELAAN